MKYEASPLYCPLETGDSSLSSIGGPLSTLYGIWGVRTRLVTRIAWGRHWKRPVTAEPKNWNELWSTWTRCFFQTWLDRTSKFCFLGSQANSHEKRISMPRCMCFLHIVMRQPNRLEKALASCLKAKNKKKRQPIFWSYTNLRMQRWNLFILAGNTWKPPQPTFPHHWPMAVVSPHSHRIFSTPRRFHPPGHPRIVELCPWMKTGTTCRRWHLQEFSQQPVQISLGKTMWSLKKKTEMVRCWSSFW